MMRAMQRLSLHCVGLFLDNYQIRYEINTVVMELYYIILCDNDIIAILGGMK